MRKINLKVIGLNLVALGCLILTFVHDWLWIIPAVVFSGWGYKELVKR